MKKNWKIKYLDMYCDPLLTIYVNNLTREEAMQYGQDNWKDREAQSYVIEEYETDNKSAK